MIELFIVTAKGVKIPLDDYVKFIKDGKERNDEVDRRNDAKPRRV